MGKGTIFREKKIIIIDRWLSIVLYVRWCVKNVALSSRPSDFEDTKC